MDLIYRYDPFQPIEVRRPADADEAIASLLAGNQRLVDLVKQMQRATLGEEAPDEIVVPISPVSMGLPLWAGAALDQRPFAFVLGCSDARVPIESVFDKSFNEMFVVRIAGNVLGTECLGSFHYAVRALGQNARLIVVLGHSGCGAVTAAVDTYLAPNAYADILFTHALRSLVDRVMVAVRGAAKSLSRVCGNTISAHPNYRTALIDVAVFLNAAINAFDLRRQVEEAGNTSLAVRYGVCDLKTLMVTGTPVNESTVRPELRAAPADASDFVTLADQVVAAIVAAGVLD